MHQRNTEGLKSHAQGKREHTFERAEAGIRQLIKEGRPINFETVKEVSGVSRAWLYNQPELRQRIEQLRGQGQVKKTVPPQQKASNASNAAKVKTLLQEVKKLRAENQGLRQHLEEVHGRALYADEEAERYKREVEAVKAERNELKKLLKQYQFQSEKPCTNDVTSISQRRASNTEDKAEQIQLEVANLGIQLNSTLKKLIEDTPEESLLTALAALKEALDLGKIKNPAGWLKRAIEDAWQPNNHPTQANLKNDLDLFNEWFPLAKSQGLVVASTQQSGKILILTVEEEWLPFAELINRHPILDLSNNLKQNSET
ncbi:DUF6262 family protein [Nodosilinea sp. AN01ver1]|uniref:DUF6262 family protein n=1 Tax=Nodosilinea sp. AN01ver1 TaxID=3423362 RepID=UPI003D3237E6